MDGTGPSGVTLDLSKAQILIIDFEWLGTGRVRIGFIIDGNIFFVHEFNTANVLSVVYMSTPNLPLRYEIENTGAGGATILEHLCSTVISEGGVDDLGILRSQSLEVATVNANVIGTYYALLGIRQKSARLDSTIAMIRLSTLSTTNDPYHWQIRWNPTVAGTFVYADETNSLVQIAKGDTSGNPSANTVTSGTIVDSGYGTENSSLDTVITNTLRLGATISGTQDEIVLCVTPGSVNLDITGAFTWRELA